MIRRSTELVALFVVRHGRLTSFEGSSPRTRPGSFRKATCDQQYGRGPDSPYAGNQGTAGVKGMIQLLVRLTELRSEKPGRRQPWGGQRSEDG